MNVNDLTQKMATKYNQYLELRLKELRLSQTLCVHEEQIEMIPESNFFRNDFKMTYTLMSHVLEEGVRCLSTSPKTQYGPLTLEILEQIHKDSQE